MALLLDGADDSFDLGNIFICSSHIEANSKFMELVLHGGKFVVGMHHHDARNSCMVKVIDL